MATKTVRVSADNITYHVLPGDTADLSIESASLSDTLFGQDFASTQSGLINWSVTGNARWRGFAGYCAKIKKAGTSTPFTAQAMTLVSGKTYEITNRAQSAWNWAVPITVQVGAAPVAASNIQSIDYMHGRVTFVPAYTPSGAVTVTGAYFPLADFGRANSFSLTQSAETADTTDFTTACTNGGFTTSIPTLLTADLELSGFYRATNDFFDLLTGRTSYIIEIDPEGNGLSVARGVYKAISDSQSGDVGGNETETISFGLSVPEGVTPFGWRHATNTTLPQGLRVLQDAWINKTNVYVEYLAEGVGAEGRKGQAIVTDLSVETSVDGLVEFSVTLTGTGALAVIP